MHLLVRIPSTIQVRLAGKDNLMAKKTNTRKVTTPIHLPYDFLDMVGDGALLSALFLVLPFSPLRFENFLSDKQDLLTIQLLVIIGVWIAKAMQGRRPNWSALFKNPIFVGAVLVITITVLSNLFSLSPVYSWIGKGRMPNGTLMHLTYFVLMCQTILSLSRIRPFIIPAITLLTFVQFLWAFFIEGRSGSDLVISTAGNPNYLSSWLLMTVLLLSYELYRCFTALGDTKPTYRDRKPRAWFQAYKYIIFILIIMLFAIWTMIYAGSRGALLALIFSGVGVVLMLSVAQHRFRLILGTVGVLGIAIIGFIAITVLIPSVSDTLRVFRLSDTRRYQLWVGGVDVLSQISDPLSNSANNTDNFVSLRPLLGYGPEMTFQLQNRWGTEGFYASHIEWTFHNHLLDTLVEKGTLGILAWFIMLGGVLYYLFKEMRWLTVKHLPLLLILIVGTCATSTYILLWLQPNETWQAVIGLGIGLSIPSAIYLWILGRGIVQQVVDAPLVELTKRHIFLIFSTSIVLGHWIDLQFSFAQTVSEPLFWVILGWIVYETLDSTELEVQPVLEISGAWIVCTLFAGLHLINIYNNSFFSSLHPTSIEFLLLMLVLVTVGGIGFFLTRENHHQFHWLALGIGCGLWGVLMFIGSLMNGYLTTHFNAIAYPTSIQDVPIVLFVGAISGVGLGIMIFAVWFVVFWRQVINISAIRGGIVTICLVVGSIFYLFNFATATTTRLAWDYMSNPQEETYQYLEQIVDKMQPYLIFSQDLHVPLEFSRLEYIRLTTPTIEVQQRMDKTWQALIDTQPYFSNSQYGWLFINRYQAYFNAPPPSDDSS